MKNETELTNLLSNIRAKRDMSDFIAEPTTKSKKKAPQSTATVYDIKSNIEIEPKPIPPSLLEAVETPKATNFKKRDTKNKSEDFLSEVQKAENIFSFERNRRYYIDDKLFQTLVLLKLSGKIRNISTMVNVIIARFLEENNAEIEAIIEDMGR